MGRNELPSTFIYWTPAQNSSRKKKQTFENDEQTEPSQLVKYRDYRMSKNFWQILLLNNWQDFWNIL